MICKPKEAESVKRILSDVKLNGDAAVKKYAEKFDGAKIENFEVAKSQIRKAYREVDKSIIEAIKIAAERIERFARIQYAPLKDFETDMDGIVLGQRIVPIERVGCYVPGGRYPLPSTALMCAIPARVAGVREIIVCSPNIKPVTIVAADIAGADRIFNVGGVQAIGAMAYGTKTIPRVDKIVGPGNKYVAAAKKEIYGEAGIDFIAGPSEVLIIADKTGNPEFIAADLLAQAEHDPCAKTCLITTSRKIANEVDRQIKLQLGCIKTRAAAELALKNYERIIAGSLDKAVRKSNEKAPEHLELQVEKPETIMEKLYNYGSLFIGEYSAEVFGDYCSGTNHTLPTGGAARYTGGLSVRDFVKVLTYQKMDKKGAGRLMSAASRLGEVEGLDAHRKAAEIRSK